MGSADILEGAIIIVIFQTEQLRKKLKKKAIRQK